METSKRKLRWAVVDGSRENPGAFIGYTDTKKEAQQLRASRCQAGGLICREDPRNIEPRHDVLCGCGWGLLSCPESELPETCPLCGYWFLGNQEE